MINAKRAERLGLFNRVVPADELEATVRGLAGQIAGGPADVIADAKRTLRRSLAADLDEILEMEAAAQARAFQSPPVLKEGIRRSWRSGAPRFGGGRERPRGPRGGGVGAGTMGHGIAQVAAMAGAEWSWSTVPEAWWRGAPADPRQPRRRRGAGQGRAGASGTRPWTGSGGRTWRGRGGVDLAIEAVPERLELKRDVFEALEAGAPRHAILATTRRA
jgi:hypothetical protein